MGQARRQFARGSAGAVAASERLCIRCASVTSVSSTTSPPLCSSRREMLTNRPLRSSVCSPTPASLTAARASTAAKDCREQRLAQQFARRGIAFLDLAAGIEHQNSAGQALRSAPTGARPGVPCRRAPRPIRRAAARPGRAANRRRRKVAPTPNRTRETPPVSSERRVFDQLEIWWLPCPKKKATSVPCRYLLCRSTSYVRQARATAGASVNFLSGAQTVFAQLLDERRAANAQEPRRLGHGAVGFRERFANESDFDRRQMILQIDAAARSGRRRAARASAIVELDGASSIRRSAIRVSASQSSARSVHVGADLPARILEQSGLPSGRRDPPPRDDAHAAVEPGAGRAVPR